MTKKLHLILAVLFVTASAFAQEVLAPTDTMGIHPWDGEENDAYVVEPEQSHWSMFLGAGFNIFDGDFTSEKKHGVWAPSVSLGATYHWNNTWGIGAEYKFHNYKVTGSDLLKNDGSGQRRDAEIMLKGMAHQADAFVTFDIFNAFRPQNKRKIFALDLILGGGAIFKKNSIYYGNVRLMDQILKDTPWAYNTGDRERADKLREEKGQERKNNTDGTQWDTKYKLYGVFIGGVSAEFNINRSLQLGLRAIYNYTTSDEIDGRPYRGNNNDGIFDCELLLRYKFEPRQKSNVRNFMNEQQIEDWNKGTYYKDPAVGEVKREKYAQEHPQMLATAGVAAMVPNRRDTLYIITRDTVYVMSSPVVAPVVVKDEEMPDSYVVYFENNVPELDRTALSITSKAASDLNKFTNYYAVVIGSCDNTGAIEYNQWLAVQRATNVTNTLVDRGVNVNRIYMVGRGIMQDDRAEGSYSVNRRVEIRIVKADEFAKAKEEFAYFEQFKNVKKGSAARQASDKYASSSEVLKTAIQNMKETGVAAPINEIVDALIEPAEEEVYVPVVETKEEVPAQKEDTFTENAEFVEDQTSEALDTVVVTKSMTLSKLARKYYDNNTNMWVKIFEANRDVLASPDVLEEGMVLVIPRL